MCTFTKRQGKRTETNVMVTLPIQTNFLQKTILMLTYSVLAQKRSYLSTGRLNLSDRKTVLN
jgi:hypothetical protein